jgi:hypothetical protein
MRMEEKIATWTVAVIVAGFVALIVYGFRMDLFLAETIRTSAESGIAFIAMGVTITYLKS